MRGRYNKLVTPIVKIIVFNNKWIKGNEIFENQVNSAIGFENKSNQFFFYGIASSPG